MALIDKVRGRHDLRRAAGTWPSAAPTRPAEAVPAPRRPTAARHPRAVPPGSLAASVMAAGLEDVDLGLERLSSRGRTWRLWPLGLLLGVALIVTAGALWLQARPLGASATAATQGTNHSVAAPVVSPAAALPAAAAALDPESRRAALPPPPAAEPVPGPGGLAVSIQPVESNYTVVAGDTLERIAQRYGTTVDALVGMNNLGDRNSLRVGQKLIIP